MLQSVPRDLLASKAAAGTPDAVATAVKSPAVHTPVGPAPTTRPLSLKDSLVTGLRQVPSAIADPHRWTRRWVAFSVLTVLYVTLSVLIVVPGTPVLTLDSRILHLYLWHKHPSLYGPISFVVGFGQRWIMTYILQAIFIWAAFRERSIRPLVLFGTAIATLNVVVGSLKYALGRIGPIVQSNPHDVFRLGGNIFPSGHVSNAVVLYGVLAWALPRYRKPLAVFAVVISICVALGAVFMRTHWFSDVVGGWLIGGMVLLLVPTLLPWAERFADHLTTQVVRSVRQRPRVHARVSRIYHWLLDHIPADPLYSRPANTTRRPEPMDVDAWPVTPDR